MKLRFIEVIVKRPAGRPNLYSRVRVDMIVGYTPGGESHPNKCRVLVPGFYDGEFIVADLDKLEEAIRDFNNGV